MGPLIKYSKIIPIVKLTFIERDPIAAKIRNHNYLMCRQVGYRFGHKKTLHNWVHRFCAQIMRPYFTTTYFQT